MNGPLAKNNECDKQQPGTQSPGKRCRLCKCRHCFENQTRLFISVPQNAILPALELSGCSAIFTCL